MADTVYTSLAAAQEAYTNFNNAIKTQENRQAVLHGKINTYRPLIGAKHPSSQTYSVWCDQWQIEINASQEEIKSLLPAREQAHSEIHRLMGVSA